MSKATEELRKHLRLKQRSAETERGYILDLTMFNKYLTDRYNCPVYVDDITEEDIESYLDMLAVVRSYKPGSINRQLNSIRSLCHLSLKKGWVTVNVAQDIEPLKRDEKERVYMMEEEVEEFLSAISHPLAQLAARTMAYTGLRVSECIHLTLDDVDLKNNQIYVIEGKGKKDRTVPIAQSLKQHLVEYLTKWRVTTASNLFFATEKSGTISVQYLNRIMAETTEKLKWRKKVTCHTLRHSFASNLVAKDVNIVKISKLLGHADLKTTSIYTHTSQQELSDAVDLLN